MNLTTEITETMENTTGKSVLCFSAPSALSAVKFVFASLCALCSLWLISPAPAQDKPPDEETQLRQALSEAGNSPVEFTRALERHLEKFPESAQRNDIERALVKAAIENKDTRRILLYGERVLARGADDLVILERVTRALLNNEDKESNERALKYGQRFEAGLIALEKQKPESARVDAQLRDDLDRGVARALVFQARATGNLGKPEEALALARKGYEGGPSSEGAREISRWLAKLGRNAEAVTWLADGFAMPDPRATDAERVIMRARIGELYKLDHTSETGLGDIILQAYDRTSALLAERRMRLKQIDPNAQLTNPMEFTLTGVNSEKLPLASLKGKVVVLDFWATWCGPCRAQYPLYQQVEGRFKERGDVVFLGINTDEDRSLVKPFLKDMNWNKSVYFEDGLSATLKVSSIPTTVIFNKKGEVVSRLNGFVPERFVDMLTDRIRETLEAK